MKALRGLDQPNPGTRNSSPGTVEVIIEVNQVIICAFRDNFEEMRANTSPRLGRGVDMSRLDAAKKCHRQIRSNDYKIRISFTPRDFFSLSCLCLCLFSIISLSSIA